LLTGKSRLPSQMKQRSVGRSKPPGLTSLRMTGEAKASAFGSRERPKNGLFRPLSFRAFGPDRLEEEKTTIDAADLALRRGLGGRLVRTAVAAGDWGGIERHGSAVVNLLGSGLT
jgi:hypothetical protein